LPRTNPGYRANLPFRNQRLASELKVLNTQNLRLKPAVFDRGSSSMGEPMFRRDSSGGRLGSEDGFANIRALSYISAAGLGGLAGLAAFQLEVAPYAQDNYSDSPGLYGVAIPFITSCVVLGIPAVVTLKVIFKIYDSIKNPKPITQSLILQEQLGGAPVIISPFSSQTAAESVYHLGTSDLVISNGFTAGKEEDLRRKVSEIEVSIVNKVRTIFDAAKFDAMLRGSANRPHETLDNYTILGEVGSGGMGTLFLAERKGEYFIIKKPQKKDKETIDRFMQEVLSLARINHDNIMKVFKLIVDPVCYVAELIRGISLSELIKSEKVAVTSQEAMVIVMRMLSALQVAHNAKVIHRDIKPGNIMINTEGTLKLIDFGLAKDVESKSELTDAGIAMGTYSYMAPENFKFGSGSVDHKVDIYAVGILLYNLIAKRPLLEFTSPKQVYEFAQSPAEITVPEMHGTPPAIRKFLEKLIAKDPNERFQTCAEVLKEANHVMMEII
jgi:hypothetical protein